MRFSAKYPFTAEMGFPGIKDPFWGGPYHKDYIILGSTLEFPYLRKLPDIAACKPVPPRNPDGVRCSRFSFWEFPSNPAAEQGSRGA